MMNVRIITSQSSLAGATARTLRRSLLEHQRRAFGSAFFSVKSKTSHHEPNAFQDRRDSYSHYGADRRATGLHLHRQRCNPRHALNHSTMNMSTVARRSKAKPSSRDHMPKPPQHSHDDDDKNGVILYERDPGSNNPPRAILGLAYFSSFYWTWYAIDFIPTVNNSSIELLHIQPWWGVAACTVAYAVNIAAGAYCKAMVSKVVLQADAAKPVHIYRHSLPFMIASSKAPIECGYGQATLDYNTTEVQNLIDVIHHEPGQQEQHPSVPVSGHLALQIKDRKFPVALYLTSTDDIKNKDLFLDTLLFAAVDMEDEAETLANSGAEATKAAANTTETGATKQKLSGKSQKNRAKGRRRSCKKC